MNQWETDFLNLENELVFTRKKLNDLIFEHQNRTPNTQDDAIYQDKLRYLEVELQYINNQLQLLKRSQREGTVDGISPYINVSDWTFVFMYLVSIAALIYVEMRNADYKLFSQIWCFFLIFTACMNNRWMMLHLYPYITVIPFMLCGK